MISHSYAVEGKLTSLNGSNMVIVWRDKDALREGITLIQAGIHQTNPALLLPLVSCMVASGTGAIITDGGFTTQAILVTEGASSGCRGTVPTENFK